MADFKPLLISFLVIFLIGAFLNFFISPFVDSSTPESESVLAGFSSLVQDGVTLEIPIPIFGTIDMSFNPITFFWLGIDGVTDFMVEQINLLSHLPDIIVIPMFVLIILAIGFSIITIVRGN